MERNALRFQSVGGRGGRAMNTGPAFDEHDDTSALLITGATGRTGGFAARLLLERGHRVRALVHSFDDRAARLRDSGAEVIVGDLNEIDDVRRAAEGARGAYFVYPISPGLIEATTTFAQA